MLEQLIALKRRLGVGLRFTAVIAAGVPSTTLLPLPLTQLLTRRFRREDMLKRIHLMVPWARFSSRKILGIELEVHGREHLPKPSRGHLFVSNHQSYVDIVVLMDALDTVAFLSKKLVSYFPTLGRCAYCGGTVFMQRGSKESRQAALEETLRMSQESTAVVVFPEGTRSTDGRIREKIYPRAMQEAWRRGLRVVPIGLHGTTDVVPKAMDRVNLGEKVAVHIGPPIDPADFAEVEAFVDTCWENVKALQARARESVERRGNPAP